MPEHIFNPEGLMRDLTYYQVRFGSDLGGWLIIWRQKKPERLEDVPYGAALFGLKNGIESTTEGKSSGMRSQGG